MPAFIRVCRAAHIVVGLFLIFICVAVTDDAAAAVDGARPSLVKAPSSAVTANPAAIEPPARVFSINRVLAEHDREAGFSDSPGYVAREPSPLPTPSEEPFGLFTLRAPDGLLWAKWRGVEAEIEKEALILAQCRQNAESCASPPALRFLALIEAARTKAGRERLDTVNRLVNSAIRYTSDLVQHGVADVWSAPLATFASGRGDCEDYAIAKYVLLRESGIAAADLRLLLVRDTSIRQDHAVLAVRQDDDWLILDNRWTVMLQSSEIRNFMPLFAIDHRGVMLFAAPYEARLSHASEIDVASATTAGNGPGMRTGHLPLLL
jgi:predicted transglutaminase-like cysteine proteinase